jgi:hypothetical protein
VVLGSHPVKTALKVGELFSELIDEQCDVIVARFFG